MEKAHVAVTYECSKDSCHLRSRRQEEIEAHISNTHESDKTQSQESEDTDVRNVTLGNGFTVADDPGECFSDTEKARRNLRLLRVPHYVQCKYCTLSPCIFEAIPEQGVGFIPAQEAQPHHDNYIKRKRLYSRTWSTLNNLGYFGLKEYKNVKNSMIAALPAPQRKSALSSKRNPLPQCCEDAIRRYYPNLPGRKYMQFK